ncbi:MAG TPA: phytoene/squalene synthase family protein [Candidatus Saccharimonadales bacterium]|nr:phytoene/squalene synthase family protein [Candidatus Saccharimonadales bacterium]
MPLPSHELLTSLLRDVSRSFYLTLRVLPKPVRSQIGLAYLLARTTDTIADTEIVPVETRLEALQNLANRIQGSRQEPLDFSRFIQAESPASERRESGAERVLLTRVEEAILLLKSFSPEDQELIRKVLITITSGQELDLRRFEDGKRGLRALANAAELDDYTYRVAGCVGEFWTRICYSHLAVGADRAGGMNLERMIADGIRFGKGLQLVNILRDVPADLKNGRCYIPEDSLRALGLQPRDLLSPKNETALRPAYHKLLDDAHEHLSAGWNYTTSLPRNWVRVRLACAWPILIGERTIALLRTQNVLDPAHRVKISRGQIKRILARSILLYPFRKTWAGLFLPGNPQVGAGNATSSTGNVST